MYLASLIPRIPPLSHTWLVSSPGSLLHPTPGQSHSQDPSFIPHLASLIPRIPPVPHTWPVSFPGSLLYPTPGQSHSQEPSCTQHLASLIPRIPPVLLASLIPRIPPVPQPEIMNEREGHFWLGCKGWPGNKS